MTEQLERDLTELFAYAAGQLDIRPFAAPRRLTRLNTALAGAVTLALVAALAVVGTRLASEGGSSEVSTAAITGERAMDDLRNVLAQTLHGRGEAVTSYSTSAGGSATFAGQRSTVTDFDGARGRAVTRAGGQTVGITIGSRYFRRIASNARNDKLPPAAEWVEEDASSTDVATGRQMALTVSMPGLVPLMLTPEGSVREWRHHFEVTTSMVTPAMTTEIDLSSAGTITTVRVQFAASPGLTSAPLMQTTFRPLSHPVDATAPDPRSVVSAARYSAAVETPQTCVTTTPSPDTTSVSCSSSTSIHGGGSIGVQMYSPSPSPR